MAIRKFRGTRVPFALTMSVSLGIVAPLSYSVFTALGAAFLLGAIAASTSSGPSAADSTSRKEISATPQLPFA